MTAYFAMVLEDECCQDAAQRAAADAYDGPLQSAVLDLLSRFGSIEVAPSGPTAVFRGGRRGWEERMSTTLAAVVGGGWCGEAPAAVWETTLSA